MRYYKVIVAMGHQGSGRSRELVFAVKAKNPVDACMIARSFPAVKHRQMPSLTKEIDSKEYLELRRLSAYRR